MLKKRWRRAIQTNAMWRYDTAGPKGLVVDSAVLLEPDDYNIYYLEDVWQKQVTT